jgi:hypothetical protein
MFDPSADLSFFFFFWPQVQQNFITLRKNRQKRPSAEPKNPGQNHQTNEAETENNTTRRCPLRAGEKSTRFSVLYVCRRRRNASKYCQTCPGDCEWLQDEADCTVLHAPTPHAHGRWPPPRLGRQSSQGATGELGTPCYSEQAK